MYILVCNVIKKRVNEVLRSVKVSIFGQLQNRIEDVKF